MDRIRITGVTVRDIRFPTSREHHGSDAMNVDPDYSAAYVTIDTDHDELCGHGLTFTIGRGTELCVAAAELIGARLVGLALSDCTRDMAGCWRRLSGDSQIRWLGPEKGVVHLALAAVVNALWDLWAKAAGKPLWRLIADMSPEELLSCIDLSYLHDELSPDAALALLRERRAGRDQRIAEMQERGYPAYTTSPGWLGYDDDTVRARCRAAIAEGWTAVKMKVGADVADDRRRAALIRSEIGPDRLLMMDANQRWEVDEAIDWMRHLTEFDPYWIEEPTSPDDVFGHAAIAEALAPIHVATGEHCQNRVLFKQFLRAGGMQVCQIDSCRLGGVNEVLAVLLLAAKRGVPVCPHAGGVGLCEYVQHVALIDYIAISGSLEGRMVEYVDHLHEHFIDPCRVVDGRYQAPTQPGYSIAMHPASLHAHGYPNGSVWQGVTA